MPQTSQQRPEFGEIIDIGEPTNDIEARYAKFYSDLQKQGKTLAVSFASGTSFVQDKTDVTEWGWLKAIRAFRLTEISAYLDGDE